MATADAQLASVTERLAADMLQGVASLLQNLSDEVRLCYERAAEAKERADGTPDPEAKADFLNMERRWLLLARSCEFGDSLRENMRQAKWARAIPLVSRRQAPINILIVDDEVKNLTALEAILDDPGYRLVRAETAEQALLALLADEFALLILDVRMPGMTGFEFAQMIKQRKKTANVPIIFLTAYYNDDQHIAEGYGTGAVDYLNKPINAAILRSKVGMFAELYRKRHNLEEVNRTLAAVVEWSDDAIISKDLNGIIATFNPGAERLFGYRAEEVVGKPATIFIPRDRQQEEPELLVRIRRGEPVHHFETVRRRKDGTLVDISLHVSPVKDDQGRITGASIIARDITRRKQARELLRRQADLLDQSHDAIFTWKLRDGIAYWSRGAELLYGYTSEEAIGHSSHELLRTRFSIPVQEIEAQIAREGSWYGELTHTTRDGRTIVVESRQVRVAYDGETYVLETNRDVTERKAHEEQVQFLVREVNHRSKNLLTVVYAIARQTASNNLEDFVERFSERIQALSANQDLLVRNDWKGVEVSSLVTAQLAHFAGLIGSRIAAHGADLRLKAASTQAIGLAIHELATNAAKYGALSADRGHVDVCWGVSGDSFTMSWTERQGPSVPAPKRSGFGTIVLQRMVELSLAGTVDFDYAPSGVTWRLTCLAADALERFGGWGNSGVESSSPRTR